MTERREIACSLGASELSGRLEEISELGAESLVSTERDGDAHRLVFRGGPQTRAALERIVEAERRCCPFLDFEVSEADDALILTIDAPPDGRPVAAQLAAAFQPTT